MKIKVKKLHPDAKLPMYSLPGDAGLDLNCLEELTIKAGERQQIRTGLAIELPPGYCALVWDKSGLSHNHGLVTLGGVFEYTYRGEYKLMLLNTSANDHHFNKGDKVAQLLIQPIATAEVEEVDELSPSPRQDRGFGSTGK
ncbi:dUTP diphosphatase [Patescibacteria group bacterium]